MKRFIIFFHGAEGTSPVVRMLDNFPGVNVVHQIQNRGWEPFDVHNCGSMTKHNLFRCLKILFSRDDEIDFEKLNEIYTKTAARPIQPFVVSNITGFKMRLFNSGYLLKDRFQNRIPGVRMLSHYLHKRAMISLCRERDVTVFISVRQDVFRRALSKYHGEETGKGKNHFQFKIADGEMDLNDVPRMQVDLQRFQRYVRRCTADIISKRKLYNELQAKGVRVFPLLYEDFLNTPLEFFRKFFDYLDHPVTDETIDRVLTRGTSFRKVHIDDISHYVVNHQELMDTFGNEYVPW